MIQPILEARVEIKKQFRSFYGSNENKKICFGNYLTFSIPVCCYDGTDNIIWWNEFLFSDLYWGNGYFFCETFVKAMWTAIARWIFRHFVQTGPTLCFSIVLIDLIHSLRIMFELCLNKTEQAFSLISWAINKEAVATSGSGYLFDQPMLTFQSQLITLTSFSCRLIQIKALELKASRLSIS